MGTATTNKIYRGGYQNNAPEQAEFPMDATAAGLKPGSLVALSGGKFIPAVIADTEALTELFVLNAPATFGVDYEYASGETGFAYIPKSGDVYAMRAADGITGGAGLKLVNSTGGQVIGWIDETAVVGYLVNPVTDTDSGDLIDVRIP